MKPIFNSLGSNYSLRFAIISFLQIFNFFSNEKNETISLLSEVLGLRVEEENIIFAYKGRDAIELALRSYGIGEGDAVISQAFSCYSIEEAILRAGAKVVYADLGAKGLNFDVDSLESVHKGEEKFKAVIIQHSLGHPAETEKIVNWARKNGLIVIEDLAQSIGGMDRFGKRLGSSADAIILSFGRDKVVDSVSGGAVIFQKKIEKKSENFLKIQFLTVVKDLIYPMLTWKIRNFHNFGLGKIIHFVAKKIKLIESPIKSEYNEVRVLPNQYFRLINYQLKNLESSLNHRRLIAEYYFKNFNADNYSVEVVATEREIKFGTNLRFAIKVSNPKLLAEKLNHINIYLNDRWYREAVDCGNLKCSTSYDAGSCPNAEKMAKKIFNLPTHLFINQKQAEKIITEIKKNA